MATSQPMHLGDFQRALLQTSERMRMLAANLKRNRAVSVFEKFPRFASAMLEHVDRQSFLAHAIGQGGEFYRTERPEFENLEAERAKSGENQRWAKDLMSNVGAAVGGHFAGAQGPGRFNTAVGFLVEMDRLMKDDKRERLIDELSLVAGGYDRRQFRESSHAADERLGRRIVYTILMNAVKMAF